MRFFQEDFVVWCGEADGKGKLRHLVLFEDTLLITRRREPIRTDDLPRFEIVETIQVHVGTPMLMVEVAIVTTS